MASAALSITADSINFLIESVISGQVALDKVNCVHFFIPFAAIEIVFLSNAIRPIRKIDGAATR